MAYTEKTWKQKTMDERKKNKELILKIREAKKMVLKKMKELEEQVKDLMYIGE